MCDIYVPIKICITIVNYNCWKSKMHISKIRFVSMKCLNSSVANQVNNNKPNYIMRLLLYLLFIKKKICLPH